MKLLWAFEPLHQDARTARNMHELLKNFSRPEDVELAYVLPEREAELYTRMDVALDLPLGQGPAYAVERALEKAGIEVGRIHVAEVDGFSTTALVDGFLELAKRRNADLVALFTHARKGIARTLLGSFAETLIHRSRIDVLLFNPRARIQGQVKNVVFAYDFEKTSHDHFQRALEWTEELRARLTVVYAAEITYKWSLDEESRHVVAYRKAVDRKVKSIQDECRRRNIPCSVDVLTDFHPIPDSILKTLKQSKGDLLIVSASTGRFAALMGGSVTRYLARFSPRPVLVLR